MSENYNERQEALSVWLDEVSKKVLSGEITRKTALEDLSSHPWFDVPWKPEYEDPRKMITGGLTVDRRLPPSLMERIEELETIDGARPCPCSFSTLWLVRTETTTDGGPVAVFCSHCGAVGLDTIQGKEKAVSIWNDKGDNREENWP